MFSFLRFQAGRTISANFTLREVSAAAYEEQQTYLLPIVVIVNHGFGNWISTTTKIDKTI
jgi:hypothetical protein